MRVEQVGRRIYAVDAPFAMKDALKGAGCKWDAERKQWWTGTIKRAELEALLAAPPPPVMSEEDRLARDRDHILGTVSYTGESGKPGRYYYVWHGTTKRGKAYRLLMRDGTKTFFADAARVSVEKTYQEPRTLASIQQYAARMRRERVTGQCSCSCHQHIECKCPAFCHYHHDGCDRCGCES